MGTNGQPGRLADSLDSEYVDCTQEEANPKERQPGQDRKPGKEEHPASGRRTVL